MKPQLLATLLLATLLSTTALGGTADVVQPIIDAFQTGDRDYIVKHVSYPLSRDNPIPSIDNEDDFINRFDDVFDVEIISRISSSDPQTDWQQVGWRGIMFGRGELWVDEAGYITVVNYQSNTEKEVQAQLIQDINAHLHPSVANISRPILEWETGQFRVRVDELDDSSIQYAAWDIESPTSEQPDLVLKNGVQMFDGSGGNHVYSFENGEYKYECYVIRLGNESDPAGYLRVFKGEKLLLEQAVERMLVSPNMAKNKAEFHSQSQVLLSEKSDAQGLYSKILDTYLVGLEKLESNGANDALGEYMLDSTGACYAAFLLKIMISSEEVVISNYYDSTFIKNLKISSVQATDSEVIIATELGQILNIKEAEGFPIYALEYFGEPIKGVFNMSEFLIKFSDVDSFAETDCGDFGG